MSNANVIISFGIMNMVSFIMSFNTIGCINFTYDNLLKTDNGVYLTDLGREDDNEL